MAKLMAESVLGFGSKKDLVMPCSSSWVQVLQGLCLVPGFKMVVRFLPPPSYFISCWRIFLCSRMGLCFQGSEKCFLKVNLSGMP